MDNSIQKNKNELWKISSDDFLKMYAIAECQMKYRDIKTVKKAIEYDSPTLAFIKKMYSENFVLAYIETWLYNLNEYFNIARKFNSTQISETAFYIYSDFYYLNLSEINLIMARIKKGIMGSFYQSIDGACVYMYFSDYSKERIEYLQEKERFEISNKISIKDQADFILKNNDKIPSLVALFKKLTK